MTSARDLSIVAFNEAAGIQATLDGLRTCLASRPWSWKIRVVDDGSVDERRRTSTP